MDSELMKLKQILRRFLDSTVPEKVKAVRDKIAFDALSGVVQKTPVDSGALRGNWFVDVNKVNTETDMSRRAGTAISNGNAAIQAAPTYAQITVTNSLPYVRAIEYGSSKQAPSGMLRVTVAELTGAIK